LLNVQLSTVGDAVASWLGSDTERVITWEPSISARNVGVGEKGVAP